MVCTGLFFGKQCHFQIKMKVLFKKSYPDPADSLEDRKLVIPCGMKRSNE